MSKVSYRTQCIGKYEGRLGKERTDEDAVMIDTFYLLHRTTKAQKLDDDSYPYSWNEEEEAPEKIEVEE